MDRKPQINLKILIVIYAVKVTLKWKWMICILSIVPNVHNLVKSKDIKLVN